MTYPTIVDDIDKHLRNITSKLFGNRFMPDQTLYEYLIEFLLVFVSAKCDDNGTYQTGKMKFHTNSSERLKYFIEPRMGLRRFIFFDKARKNGILRIDEEAYKEMLKIVLKNTEDFPNNEGKQDIIYAIQDLLHGYAVVIKKRSWCAQTLLPACPEMVFCDAMPNHKRRKGLSEELGKDLSTFDDYSKTVDNSFDFNKRNFMARGGELYYLHILQALENHEDDKNKLEELLSNLLGKSNNQLSKICNFIQNSWEKYLGFEKKYFIEPMSISFIPDDAYIKCGKLTVAELINFLSCELPSITRIELLAKGIIFQIMRMMSWRIDSSLAINNNWIIDMKGSSTDTIKKIASKSFKKIEDSFLTSLNKTGRDININENEFMSKLNKAKKSSIEIFRAKGKELQCIIPSKGPFERFSLSVDIIRFLVLALIPPNQKMTLNMFLKKLYKNYGIVIGPEEYRESIEDDDLSEPSLANSFAENLNSFQSFLKATGFLRELSDATSIVFNPYNNVLEGQ